MGRRSRIQLGLTGPKTKRGSMGYTVQDVSDITGISTHTLRYYDREGIMPFLKRDEHGNRVFEKSDLQWLQVVKCMKISGFTLADMRKYADLVRQGDESLAERLKLFEEHREKTLQQIADLQTALEAINYKCWYYRTSVEAGTESIHFVEDGYDQALCYQEFKTWSERRLEEGSIRLEQPQAAQK